MTHLLYFAVGVLVGFVLTAVWIMIIRGIK